MPYKITFPNASLGIYEKATNAVISAFVAFLVNIVIHESTQEKVLSVFTELEWFFYQTAVWKCFVK